MKYTDYCTCFYDEVENKVVFWNEVKDRQIGVKKVKDKEQAKQIMLKWVENAPEHVICEVLF